MKEICGYCENFYCGKCLIDKNKVADVLDDACEEFEVVKL